ncbi:hypothetical protein E2F48_02330 [Arthrobacter crusticola]|uniref:Uncharacterized protein n=1 Tax=Arthrobacter crusticola TaxID=2547960 RepID=A0A4R5U2W1_9MICC|nr:hypothetical protein [Arthrobacter crusticola]TDK27967.1 hypothetical protein E2F48_02330 [Arthrobacter crusticola]
MRSPNGRSNERNWNITGRELTTWRLLFLVFPPPIALLVDAAFGPVPAVVAGTSFYLGIIWFVITVPRKDQDTRQVEPEDH